MLTSKSSREKTTVREQVQFFEMLEKSSRQGPSTSVVHRICRPLKKMMSRRRARWAQGKMAAARKAQGGHTDEEEVEKIVRSHSPAADLHVSVTVRAEYPVDKNFHQEYETSPGFEVTDELCVGLVCRIQHCARELITRTDAKATEPLRYTAPHTKLARYRVIFRIDRRGAPWKEMHFTSFQEQTMTLQTAHEVVLETDRTVGLFLQSYDAGFSWDLPSFVHEDPLAHKRMPPVIGGPQDTQCIPSYIDTPGYSIDLSLHTQSPGCPGHDWSVKVDSRQDTPLTLDRGEDLMSEIVEILYEATKAREDDFSEMHEHCHALEGSHGCRHVQRGAFDLRAAVRNNFGPDYSHLTMRHQSFRTLINHSHADALVQILKQELETARDHCDRAINKTDELVLQVHEMRSNSWRVPRPLSVTLGPSNLHSRKTIERILERVVTGINDVLRGHGISAAVSIHKRGHLVLDRSVCSVDDIGPSDASLFNSIERRVHVLRCRLGERIQQDLAMVLRDTISLRMPLPLPDISVAIPDGIGLEPANGEAAAPVRRLSKKLRQSDLRRRSLEEEEEAANAVCQWSVHDDEFQQSSPYSYSMASSGGSGVLTASRISTPSLADTDSIHLHEGAETPDSVRHLSQNFDSTDYDLDSTDMDTSQHELETSTIGTVIHHDEPTLPVDEMLLPDQWSRVPSSQLRPGKDIRLASKGSCLMSQETAESANVPSPSIITFRTAPAVIHKKASAEGQTLVPCGSWQNKGMPQGFVPRRVCTAAEVAPTQTFVNASAEFNQRPVTSPASSSATFGQHSGVDSNLYSRHILQTQLKRKKSNSIAGSRASPSTSTARQKSNRRNTLPATTMAFTGSFGPSRWALDSQ